MDVDTGQFVAVTEQVAALAAKVDRLEQREHQREVVAQLIAGGTPGLDALPAAGTSRPRWLYSVRP